MNNGFQKQVLIADWFGKEFDLEEKALGKEGFGYRFSGIDNDASNQEKKRSLIEAIQKSSRVDALLFSIAPIDAQVIDLLGNECKLLQRLGTGLDNVDLDHARQKGMDVRNTPQYCVEEVCRSHHVSFAGAASSVIRHTVRLAESCLVGQTTSGH